MNEICIAVYQPKPGKAAALKKIVAKHMPKLRELDFVTEREAIVMQARDGSILEVFEWRPGAAAAAHEHPGVAEIWEAMAKVADFPPLAALEEAKACFSHYKPLKF